MSLRSHCAVAALTTPTPTTTMNCDNTVSPKRPNAKIEYDSSGRPVPPKESLALEVHSTRALGVRVFVVLYVRGKGRAGSAAKCSKVFNRLSTITGSEFTDMKLYPSWTKESVWNFPLSSHDAAFETLKECRVPVHGVPTHVLDLFKRPAVKTPAIDEEIERRIGDKLWSTLMPFQRDGVRFGVSRDGCVLIGDEMGLGKTFQGLSIASYYSHDWPLLIVCPSSLRHNWYNNFVEHSLPLNGRTEDICVMFKSSDDVRGRVVVVSYSLLLRKAVMEKLMAHRFQCVILDECHYIKSEEAKRSKQTLRLCARAKHRILLSGTPMSRLREIFTQIKAVDPSIFPQFWASSGQWRPDRCLFSVRYCDPSKQFIGYNRWVYKHAGNERSSELFAVLERLVMVRRRKMQVLKDLPDKVRERVVIDELVGKQLTKFQDELDRVQELRQEQGSLVGDPAFMALVRETAERKVSLVVNYLREVVWPYLEGNSTAKVIVFGHHRLMLDRIQEETERATLRDASGDAGAASAGIGFIRIDGSTDKTTRQPLVDTFQTDPSVRVAVLSIKAAGTGLTLTKANIVIMSELLFGPNDMFQAEDRAHRIGQRKTVFIRYLMLKGSTDDLLWKMIQAKTRNVGLVLDNRAEYLVAKEVSAPNADESETCGTTNDGRAVNQPTIQESMASQQQHYQPHHQQPEERTTDTSTPTTFSIFRRPDAERRGV
jgi:SWI/SNF-related matrix-associated actin-dependent regulator 1 of chromatin subfamily A